MLGLCLCEVWVWKSLSCVWLCDPTDYSLPGSSVPGIVQTRILEWVPGPFSRGSSQSRDRIQVFHIAVGFFTIWATREALSCSTWDIVPWPGIEPGPPALREWSLNHWTTREVPKEPLDEGERGEWKSWLKTAFKTKIMVSGPITSWQIEREKLETVTDFIFLGSKITVDGDCSHEIERCLFLGWKTMTN